MSLPIGFAELAVKESSLNEITKNTDLSKINVSELDKPFSDFEKKDISEGSSDTDKDEGTAPNDKQGMTEEEKGRIREETGWSDEIIDAISSMEEYEIYKGAGLQEAEIEGRKCLIRPDIDMDQKDSMGRTNKERMEQGLAPLTKDGKVVELHHIGQQSDSPLAELTMDEHRGKGNDSVLHDKTQESEIDRNVFNGEKEDHWKARAEGSE